MGCGDAGYRHTAGMSLFNVCFHIKAVPFSKRRNVHLERTHWNTQHEWKPFYRKRHFVTLFPKYVCVCVFVTGCFTDAKVLFILYIFTFGCSSCALCGPLNRKLNVFFYARECLCENVSKKLLTFPNTKSLNYFVSNTNSINSNNTRKWYCWKVRTMQLSKNNSQRFFLCSTNAEI